MAREANAQTVPALIYRDPDGGIRVDFSVRPPTVETTQILYYRRWRDVEYFEPSSEKWIDFCISEYARVFDDIPLPPPLRPGESPVAIPVNITITLGGTG